MITRYSLAQYVLSIKPSDELSTVTQDFGTITVGGEGSLTDNISVKRESNLFATTGYATGGWTHDKSLDKHGTISVTISQLSDQVQKFIRFCETFYNGDYQGFTLTLTTNDADKRVICTGTDCYIQDIPGQEFGKSAGNQTWTFTCGRIDF